MSISLRKSCQPSLDAAGLSMVHVGVKNKILTIVGPCGQPLVTVSGIEFDTNTPKKMEIPYALNLFEEFLSQKSSDITTYLQLKHAFSELEQPSLEPITKANLSCRNITYTTNGYEMSYDRGSKKLSSVKVLNDATFSITNASIAINEAEEVLTPYFQAVTEYNEKEKELSTLRTALQTCNI